MADGENIQKTVHVENIQRTVYVENIQKIVYVENIQNIVNVENIQKTANVENIQNTDDVENIQKTVNGTNILKKIDVSSILLDIEGTTTSIDYVKEELFPYASFFMEDFVKTNWNNDNMKEVLDILLKDQVKLEEIDGFIRLGPVPTVQTELEEYKNKVIAHLKWQQSKNCKTTGLKKLQGYIWIRGYEDGVLQGHVYEDVPEVLKFWKSLGMRIFIYSSGSIDAQKLLFCNSVKGNLYEFIDGNFDTTIGSKIEAESYLKIASVINEKPENIIFFTDRPKEVSAAKKAGLSVVRVAREGNNPFLEEEKEFLGTEDAVVESFIPLIKK